MERVTAAAQYGYWAPPEVIPDERTSLLRFLKGLLPVLHAEICQWRSSPATALNQIGMCLDIATNARVSPAEAEQRAITYLREARERVFRFSRRAPFQSPSDPGFGNVQSAFLTTDLGLLQALGQWVGQESSPALGVADGRHAPAQPLQASEKEQCFWFGIGRCTNKKCPLAHGPRPYCRGEKCGNQQGYISWHLSDLHNPRKIVMVSDSSPQASAPKRSAGAGDTGGKDQKRARYGDREPLTRKQY